jgi:peptide deformylase
MKRPLAYFGDPLLRQKSKEVEKIDHDIHVLVADMIETMYAHQGVGISAVQVKSLLRIFIICPDVVDENGNYVEGTPQIFINPKLSLPSKEQEAREEGCLSIPKVYGSVMRPKEITIEGLNLAGEKVIERLVGYPARIAMHENDHINGVLFVDRLSDKDRKAIEKDLREIKKTYHS